jgi:succinyl-diaminopimelate desuccinylase
LLNLLDDFRNKGIDIRTNVLQEGEAVESSEESYLARSLVSSVRMVRGKRPQFLMCPGLLETRYYVQHGIPAYAYGPGLLEQAHHPFEFVPVEHIYDCTAVYALTALKVLKQKGVR